MSTNISSLVIDKLEASNFYTRETTGYSHAFPIQGNLHLDSTEVKDFLEEQKETVDSFAELFLILYNLPNDQVPAQTDNVVIQRNCSTIKRIYCTPENFFFLGAGQIDSVAVLKIKIFSKVKDFLHQIPCSPSDLVAWINQFKEGRLEQEVSQILKDKNLDCRGSNYRLMKELFEEFDVFDFQSNVYSLFDRRKVLRAPRPRLEIYLGPPGTGKTREAVLSAAQIVSNNSSRIETYKDACSILSKASFRVMKTQFHPSYSYEDFVEGLRPINERLSETSGGIYYDLVDGPFKAACAIAKNLVRLPLAKTKWSSADALVYQPLTWAANLYSIGVTFKIEDKRLSITSTTVPNISDYFPAEEAALAQIQLGFITWHPFGRAKKADDVVLIIDEINRGDVSSIFGELLTAIEEEYRRDGSEGVRLQHSKDVLIVPMNLHIIGTMNTADRSLTHLDQAFRRRFEFREFRPLLDELLITNYTDKKYTWNNEAKESGLELVESIAGFGYADKIAKFAGTVLQELNELLNNPDRSFGHSFGLRRMENLLIKVNADHVENERRKRTKDYIDKLATEEIREMWLLELLPSLKLMPNVFTYDDNCQFLPSKLKKFPALTELITKIHGQPKDSGQQEAFWSGPMQKLDKARRGEVVSWDTLNWEAVPAEKDAGVA